MTRTRCTCHDGQLCFSCEQAIGDEQYEREHPIDVDATQWQQGQDEWERMFYAAGGDR